MKENPRGILPSDERLIPMAKPSAEALIKDNPGNVVSVDDFEALSEVEKQEYRYTHDAYVKVTATELHLPDTGTFIRRKLYL